ncbi:DUF1016 family protein [bacterium]|nr:DUF1016 family protein [bacterium]
MSKLEINKDYKKWLLELKLKIKSSQIKAALQVNSELIALYWNIGAMICEKQSKSNWGSKLIEQVATDLKSEFPDLTGFSRSNLYSMRQFYLFYNQHDLIVQQLVGQIEDIKKETKNEIVQQVAGQFQKNEIVQKLKLIPWGHHTLIFQKIKKINEALFYVEQTIENNWSRSVLEYQIETNLYSRQGKAITNFKNTLPEPESDLAQQLLKDPYNFDFLTLSKKAKEKDLELKLINHISDFLLELGKGFAYMGRQYKLKVGNKEYFTDLLFYHTKLKAYVIIELKMTEFEPEFIGKLNFYTSAINELVKDETDKPTIGILLCKNKDNFVVDFSIKDINKPIGVSEFSYNELPEDIKSELPSEKQLQEELKKIECE